MAARPEELNNAVRDDQGWDADLGRHGAGRVAKAVLADLLAFATS
jgi:hypothetical protein